MAWNIDDGFIVLYRTILKDFRSNLHSYPSNMTLEEWDCILDEMIDLLDEMNIDKTDMMQGYHKEIYNEVENSKSRFFELFSKYFYDLWN